MADKRRKEPEEGPYGIDRWTSNGYGLEIDGKKVEPLATDETEEDDIDEIDEVE